MRLLLVSVDIGFYSMPATNVVCCWLRGDTDFPRVARGQRQWLSNWTTTGSERSWDSSGQEASRQKLFVD